MEYRSYSALTGIPNVIADGHPRKSTVLTLSHWPDSTTPPEFKRDLSAEIALAYIDSPDLHVDASVVSNNHFDIDGFMAVWALCNPLAAVRDRTLVAEVARAGDFGWTRDDRAAKVAFALGTLKTPAVSPLAPEVFAGQEPVQVANLYRALLDTFGDLAADIEDREDLWRHQHDQMMRTTDALRRGDISIREEPILDLAIVDVAESVVPGVYPYCLQYSGPCHPLPIHQRTDASRILYFRGDWVGFLYRFESWVSFQSRDVPGRVDLTGAAATLTAAEKDGAVWSYAWPNNPNPPVAWLSPAAPAPTTLDRTAIIDTVSEALAAPPAAAGPTTYS